MHLIIIHYQFTCITCEPLKLRMVAGKCRPLLWFSSGVTHLVLERHWPNKNGWHVKDKFKWKTVTLNLCFCFVIKCLEFIGNIVTVFDCHYLCVRCVNSRACVNNYRRRKKQRRQERWEQLLRSGLWVCQTSVSNYCNSSNNILHYSSWCLPRFFFCFVFSPGTQATNQFAPSPAMFCLLLHLHPMFPPY